MLETQERDSEGDFTEESKTLSFYKALSFLGPQG